MILFYIKKMTDKMNNWLKRIDFFCFKKNSSFLDNLSQLYFWGILIQLANICSFFIGRSFWEAKSNFWIHTCVCAHTHTYTHNSKYWKKTFEQKTCYHKFFLFLLLLYFINIVDSLICIFLLIYFIEKKYLIIIPFMFQTLFRKYS